MSELPRANSGASAASRASGAPDESSAPRSGRKTSVLVLFVAGAAGACTMAVELAAVRLLAPWFGTSTAVWTNVIGVILLSLSVGYLLGARLSRAARPARWLAFTLFLAAGFAAWLPGVTHLVASWFLPEGLTLDEAARLLPWGSLATALVLFLPSTLLLGCVAPLSTEILQRTSHGSAGRAGGAVLCVSTLGSLVGTFGTTYYAVPELGLTRTFLVAGSILFALAFALSIATRTPPRGGSMAVVLPFVAATLLSRAPPPQAKNDMTLLEARESTYQSVRVVESGAGPDRLRFLQVNESFDSFQSVWQARAGFLPDGYYYNFFAMPLWWSRDVTHWRVAVLGLGAGTALRVLDGARPEPAVIESTGAEIDPVVVEMAGRWLDLAPDGAGHRVLAGVDGRAALRAMPGELDLIVLDAYANQMEIPAHLSTREMFVEARSKLARGGWLVSNVGGFTLDDPVVVAVARTLARAFEQRVLALRVPFSRNCVLFVRNAGEPPEPGSAAWRTGASEVDRRLSAVELRGTWAWFAPSNEDVLTDDLNPIEWLQRRSLLAADERSPRGGS